MKVMREKDIDQEIQDTLARAPIYRGHTIQELSDITENPRATTRWHLELLEARGVVEHFEIGRAKLYSLKNEE